MKIYKIKEKNLQNTVVCFQKDNSFSPLNFDFVEPIL